QGLVQVAPSGYRLDRGQSFTAKASEKYAGTVSGNAGPGANSTSALTKRRLKSSAPWPARMMSAAPKPCRICFKACPERSNESAPSALTISKNAVTHSIDTERGLPSHSAKARRSGGMQAQRLNAMRVTRIYGASEKNGRKEWKRESNYHRRSLAETQVCR